MKIRVVNIAEIFLFIIFVVATVITKQKMARLGFVAIPAVLLLGALYFPLGYYTLQSNKINQKYAAGYGMLFSLSLAAIFFSILNASFTIVLLLSFIIIFLTLAVVETGAVSFFNQPPGKIIQRDTATFVRYVVLFISMIVALAVYPTH